MTRSYKSIWRYALSLALMLAVLLGADYDAQAQRKKKNKKNKGQTETPAKTPARRPAPKKGGMQPYDKVITKGAKSDEGLFTVHKIDGKYFFEIPDSLLNREMLMVTRIAKTASGIGFGGGKTNTQVLTWEKVK